MQNIEVPQSLLIKYHTLTKSENNFNKNLNLNHDDEKLWKELSESGGDYSAFERILFRYGVNVLQLAQKFIISGKIAQHILKETFSALYRKRGELTAAELKELFFQETKKNIYEQLSLLFKDWEVQEKNTTDFYKWAAERTP